MSFSLRTPCSKQVHAHTPLLHGRCNEHCFASFHPVLLVRGVRAWCTSHDAQPCDVPPVKANGKKGKRRLDAICCELAPEYSKNVIQSFILSGKVYVDNQKVTKAGAQISASAVVEIRAEVPKYVCRAGLKLEKALEEFGIDVTGLTALDSGLSTGGFTDCLLQNGASKVYGVDVGYGQVAEKVRVDPRVTVMERTNLRALTPDALPCSVDIVTLDLSFISVLKVMAAVVGVMKPASQLVVLIKPQFEAGPANVAKGGIVRSEEVRQEVVARVSTAIEELGFTRLGLIESPIRGAQAGNKEFLAHFRRIPNAEMDISEWVMKWAPPSSEARATA